MRIPFVPILIFGLALCLAGAQTSPPAAPQSQPASPPAAPAGASPASEETGDRFPALRQVADALKSAYEQLDAKNMDEIESLLKTKRCQINRIGGLIDRVQDAMRLWLESESKYWKAWSEVEQRRIDSQTKTLASMEEDQKRVADGLQEEKASREELLRKRAELDKYGKKTAEIVAQIDGIIKDIKESEDHLESAQKDFDELTVKINNMRASISARVVDMRQNTARLEAFGLDMAAYYEKNRNAGNEVCNTKQPDTKRAPLPTVKR